MHRLDLLGTLAGGPTAYLNRPCPELPFYFDSYKQAGETLYAAIEASSERATDLAIPWLFLRRHGIELLLKATLEQVDEIDNHDPRHPLGHSLSALWGRLWGPSPTEVDHEKELHERCSRLVAELDLLDPVSATFRYPADESGASTLHDFPDRVDVRVMKTQLDDLYEYLETCFYRMDHGLERTRIRRMLPPNLVDLVENQWRTASSEKRDNILFWVEHGARNGFIPGKQLQRIHLALQAHRAAIQDGDVAARLDAILEEVADLFVDRRVDSGPPSG